MEDETLQTEAKVNELDTFKFAFDDKFIDKLIARMDQNQEIFEKILEDKAFGDLVKELMMKRIFRKLNESNLILYTTQNGQVSVQVQYEDGSFWLTQKRMAELFNVEIPTINYHLKEIYQSSELQIDSTIRKIRIVQL